MFAKPAPQPKRQQPEHRDDHKRKPDQITRIRRMLKLERAALNCSDEELEQVIVEDGTERAAAARRQRQELESKTAGPEMRCLDRESDRQDLGQATRDLQNDRTLLEPAWRDLEQGQRSLDEDRRILNEERKDLDEEQRSLDEDSHKLGNGRHILEIERLYF